VNTSHTVGKEVIHKFVIKDFKGMTVALPEFFPDEEPVFLFFNSVQVLVLRFKVAVNEKQALQMYKDILLKQMLVLIFSSCQVKALLRSIGWYYSLTKQYKLQKCFTR
jgi:hypothetical protein